MAEPLFRKESLAQVSSPEQLFDYIKAANPSIWIVLGAVFVLVSSLLVWAAAAAIPVMVSSPAIFDGEKGEYLCFLPVEQGAKLKTGMGARIGEFPGRVSAVSEIPLSRKEAAELLPGAYAVYALGLSDWNIQVRIRLDDMGQHPPGDRRGSFVFATATVTTDIVRPFSFLFD
ncbi:MAG: hypothetical protein LBP80_09475 [Treponema sp.]|jgi:hypothetical protein|nr:hypothetical protein [Treponema sp.]